MKVTQCKATNADGKPCAANQIRPSGWCYWHDPDLEQQRTEGRIRGGQNRSNANRAKAAMKRLEMADLDGILCSVLGGLLKGRYEPGVATAAATLVRTISQLRTTQELEARLAEIETLVRGGTKAA